MAGTTKHAKLESATARKRLKVGRQPHWQTLIPGRAHLGWQCDDRARGGRWVLRRYSGGKYSVQPLGRADDLHGGDGISVLDYAQAIAKAQAALSIVISRGKVTRMTVRQAMAFYIEHQQSRGKPINDITTRSRVHIEPALGDLIVDELEPQQLRKWMATMASMPAQMRPTTDGKPQYRSAPKTEEDRRRRMSSANRVFVILSAALNLCRNEGKVSGEAWRKVKRFKDVDQARLRYLEMDECHRLLNACAQDFRALVRAGLETGCRFSELARLQVSDFNKQSGTVTIAKSKSGKMRHIILTDDGISFFKAHCLGRGGGELMFTKDNGKPWKRGEQNRPMHRANIAARLTPRATFHALRHTWASLATMGGTPLLVVAKNLGHRDTSMVERHYGHLAPSYITDAIRAGAPRFGRVIDRKVADFT